MVTMYSMCYPVDPVANILLLPALQLGWSHSTGIWTQVVERIRLS